MSSNKYLIVPTNLSGMSSAAYDQTLDLWKKKNKVNNKRHIWFSCIKCEIFKLKKQHSFLYINTHFLM